MPLFYVQALFSGVGMAFTMTMLYRGANTGVYLPVLVSMAASHQHMTDRS